MMRVKFERTATTLADIEDYEAYTGEAWSRMTTYGDAVPMRSVVALVWITLRRDDPTWTIERVRQMPAIEVEIDTGAAPNAQEPAANEGDATG